MQWALGYATKNGLEIRSESGNRVTISATKSGNMFHPDAEEFDEKFLRRLQEGDVVLSPSGPNYTYLPGAYSRGASVYWIHPAKLAEVTRTQTPKHLHERFGDRPKDFYPFEPQDERVAALGIVTKSWIALERQRAGEENAASQLLRRERDYFRFTRPDRDAWIARHAKVEQRKLTARMTKVGVELDTAQKHALHEGIQRQAEQLYASYFARALDAKEEKRAKEALIRMRLEWFGIEELEDFYAAEVRQMLAKTPENTLFDNLIGAGAVKTRAQVLTFIRNPRFYPTAGHLRSYAGLKLKEGQAIQRRRGEATSGNPEFKRALVFDFAEKYWQNDPIGFFRDLYYAYKANQYYQYWELIELTSDMFAALGKKSDDEDDAEIEADAEAPTSTGTEIRPLVDRLVALQHLDLIAKSPRIRHAIDALDRDPTPQLLWKIFSRSPAVGGLNLQMTPKRIERQIKRCLGATLLDAIYYRWLTAIGEPLPIREDFLHVDRWRYVTGKATVFPETYDHELVFDFYRKHVEALRATRELPEKIQAKFLTPEERKERAAVG